MSDSMNDMMIVPGPQMRALVSLILAERVQRPLDQILNDEAEELARLKAMMEFYGTPADCWIQHQVTEITRISGLRSAIKTMDPFLQLQMVEHPPDEEDAAHIESDRDEVRDSEGETYANTPARGEGEGAT
jgi:hypothetical protein